MDMSKDIILMTENEIYTLLETYNYLEGMPKNQTEVAEDAHNIYIDYCNMFRNTKVTLGMFKLIVWDVFEYYLDEPDCTESLLARKFIKETYLYYD